MGARIMLWALLAVACSARELAVVVPTVPAEGAKSMLYAVEIEGRLVELAATDGSEGAVQLDAPEAAASEVPPGVWAMAYERSLRELGLEVGRVPRDPDGQPLPRPDRALRTEARIGAPAWQVADPPESLAAYPVRTKTRCARFDVRMFTTQSYEVAVAVLADDADGAWLVTADQQVHHLSPDGLERVADLQLAASPTWGARRGTEYWLSDDEGGLYAGDFVRGFAAITQSPRIGTGWFAISPADQPFELMTASYQGALAVYDGVNWLEVLDPVDVDWPWGGVVWIQPGHFLATGAASVYRYRDHRLSSDIPASVTSESFSALAHLGPSNTMLGGLDGLYRHDGSSWVSVGRSGVFKPHCFAAYEDGFIVGGALSTMALYDPQRGFCDLPPIGATPRLITRVGSGYFIGFYPSGEALPATDRTVAAWLSVGP